LPSLPLQDLPLRDPVLSAFGEFVTQLTGLAFDPARSVDLRRAVTALTHDLAFEDANACMRSLMDQPMTPRRLELLAHRLTVPETYFFRETACLDVLATHILPELIHTRRTSGHKLQLWSAACCTGEEAYSAAIVLMRTLPDWQAWDISILATDLNPANLRKAQAGIYGEWSFRGAPGWLKTDYFKPTSDGHWEISQRVRQAVRFEQLNLADNSYPSPATHTTSIDVIICGNVLMYFSDDQATKTLERLYRAQAEGGWLIVGPNDTPRVFPTPYKRISFPRAVVYRKATSEPFAPVPTSTPAAPLAQLPPPARLLHPPALTPAPPAPKIVPPAYADLARDLANQGRLAEALKTCDLWIAARKSDPLGHYIRSVILLEMGHPSQAAASLRTVIYLQSDFVMAHFILGQIAQNSHQHHAAKKHMSNVLNLLSSTPPEQTVPESDGMTAQGLLQAASAILQPEVKA
jgi:chemotaxis protein methyltransferase CheR